MEETCLRTQNTPLSFLTIILIVILTLSLLFLTETKCQLVSDQNWNEVIQMNGGVSVAV